MMSVLVMCAYTHRRQERMARVGQNHMYLVNVVYTVLFAGVLSNIRPHTAYIYGSGQPYLCALKCIVRARNAWPECVPPCYTQNCTAVSFVYMYILCCICISYAEHAHHYNS